MKTCIHSSRAFQSADQVCMRTRSGQLRDGILSRLQGDLRPSIASDAYELLSWRCKSARVGHGQGNVLLEG